VDGMANHFPVKMHYIAGFCIYNLNFSGGNTPTEALPVLGPPTPAWLACVPIVPVLRNDHWYRHVSSGHVTTIAYAKMHRLGSVS